MGNTTSSKERHDDSVDFGALYPQGIYTGPQDWNQQVVGQLIVERRLAPFYRPLEDYEEDWDDDQILAARKELPHDPNAPSTTHAPPTPPKVPAAKTTRSGKDPQRLTEAHAYRGAVECPICFLYYPPNINRSRCCFQAICTECFVQIKRNEPTATHLVSEPACCPYCVQDNFGVIYTPPPWRTGIGSDGTGTYGRPELAKTMSSMSDDSGKSSRRKSIGHNSPDVVTIDQIRPDWEAKLAAVQAAVARRANRRIIMRQVGDRLIPVGVTSGRVHPIVDGSAGDGSGSGRRRNDINQLLGSMGLGGQDLEELMVMEAMRLSLLEHEEQQRREAAAAAAAAAATQGNASAISASAPASSAPIAVPRPPSTSSEGARPSSASSAGAGNRRSGYIPVSPSPLAHASNSIALAIGFPGGGPSAEGDPLQQQQGSSRRSESISAPPTNLSTLTAAISASSTAAAILPPPSPENAEQPSTDSSDSGTSDSSDHSHSDDTHESEHPAQPAPESADGRTV